jgi:hypothetical protein
VALAGRVLTLPAAPRCIAGPPGDGSFIHRAGGRAGAAPTAQVPQADRRSSHGEFWPRLSRARAAGATPPAGGQASGLAIVRPRRRLYTSDVDEPGALRQARLARRPGQRVRRQRRIRRRVARGVHTWRGLGRSPRAAGPARGLWATQSRAWPTPSPASRTPASAAWAFDSCPLAEEVAVDVVVPFSPHPLDAGYKMRRAEIDALARLRGRHRAG